jgi:hypothetical protein
VELSSGTVPQQLHQNSSKSVLEKGDRYAFSSLLYHAVLKSPNFHRAVENVSTKCATGIWPKEGVGVSGLGANAFSRRLAATPLCSRPHLHLAVLLSSAAPLLASPRSSLLSDSPRSSLLTAIQTFPPSEGPGPTNASLERHWYTSTMQENFTRRYGQPWPFLFHFTILPPAVLSATSQPQSIPLQFSRSNFHAVPSFSNDHK